VTKDTFIIFFLLFYYFRCAKCWQFYSDECNNRTCESKTLY